uniref:Transmembrane protein n=1 Tax=Trypanosoma vivax (strain Y486) TaxID=1055687 RepID=G0TY13_TRYVY|nr:hypothetical protein TVY486_0701950 [Trypanosoma vivax Y486]
MAFHPTTQFLFILHCIIFTPPSLHHYKAPSMPLFSRNKYKQEEKQFSTYVFYHVSLIYLVLLLLLVVVGYALAFHITGIYYPPQSQPPSFPTTNFLPPSRSKRFLFVCLFVCLFVFFFPSCCFFALHITNLLFVSCLGCFPTP